MYSVESATSNSTSNFTPSGHKAYFIKKHLLLLYNSLHICPGVIKEMLAVIIFDHFSNSSKKIYIVLSMDSPVISFLHNTLVLFSVPS
jgi:hypothetical protein